MSPPGKLTFSWTPLVGVAFYQIEHSHDGGATWVPATSVGPEYTLWTLFLDAGTVHIRITGVQAPPYAFSMEILGPFIVTALPDPPLTLLGELLLDLGTAAYEDVGVPGGVAELDGTGKVPSSQLPTSTFPVTSVAGRAGDVVLVVEDISDSGATGRALVLSPDTGSAITNIGLGNVNNTSDAAKPVSTAQQAALDLKLNISSYTAADVIAKLLTVDGAGTSLDADLLDGVQASAFELVANKDTDGTLAANSDTKYASQKAVKTYVDQIIAAQDAMIFKGVIDCSANPNYPAADRGWTYRVSVSGKIGGASGPNVEAGDLLLCLTDGTASGNHATVGTAWSISQVNLDGAVIGPASATSGNAATFSDTSGKLIQDSGKAFPTGAIVGTTDSQALTNKTVALGSNTVSGTAAQFDTACSDDNFEYVSRKGAASGYASLDGSGKVPSSQLPPAVVGAISYQGGWNASTNSPTIPAAAAGNTGWYYVVTTAGSTNINGETDWKLKDWLVSNGTTWDKIDNTDQVTQSDLNLKATKADPRFTGVAALGNTTIDAWAAGYSVQYFGRDALIFAETAAGGSNTLGINQNAYYDGAWKRIEAGPASNYYQNSGTHVWRVAPSSTASSTITWTNALTIDNSGDLTGTAVSQTVNDATKKLANTQFVRDQTQSYVANATFDLATANGGTIDISFGFDVRSVEIVAAVSFAQGHCTGFVAKRNDGTIQQGSVNVATDGLTNIVQTGQILLYTNASTANYQQGVATFITNGIRITFAKNGSITGTLIIVARGQA